MNKTQWSAQRHSFKGLLASFRHLHRTEMDEISAAREVLKKHADLIREYEALEEQANAMAPEGHVRCQAVHHGLLICDEIARMNNLPQDWVVSVVGDLCYCPLHHAHADVVNAPTRETAEFNHRPRVVEEVVRRR